MPGEWLVNLRQARNIIANNVDGERAAFIMRRGSMRIGLYAPTDVDRQGPHAQDEVYLVLTGTGIAVVGGQRRHCEVGDLIFVAAGVEHRFEEFGTDFVLCVFFWGPEGGESPASVV